jgi:two-component system cell cycle sensor histidine kinase/response regulator CckA
MTGRSTILIVDDEVLVRNVIVAILGKDYHVLEADSPTEALTISQEFQDTIDLLIADHSLKTMTGRQIAEKLSQARPSTTGS